MNRQATDQATELTRLVEEAINRGADTAEEINRAVLELPVAILESMGLEDTAGEVKRIQDRSIGAIYKLVRDFNHSVAEVAAELLERREGNTES